MDPPAPSHPGSPGQVAWTSGSAGRGFFPWDGQEGPLAEGDLVLLRALYELLPPGGVMLATFPDHEVVQAYAGKVELGIEPLPATWVASGEAGLARGGAPCMLLQLKRFGDLVELFAFANRDGTGSSLNAFLVADEARLGDLMAVLRRLPGSPADPTPHVEAWGLLESPGPERAARLLLRTGAGREADLAGRWQGFLDSRIGQARALGPSPGPADRRRFLHRLLDEG